MKHLSRSCGVIAIFLSFAGIACAGAVEQNEKKFEKASFDEPVHPRDFTRLFRQSNEGLVLDVNDSFIVSSASHGEAISFAILDGARNLYGNCKSGRSPRLGEARETWIKFEFGSRSDSGSKNITITRTIDFLGHSKKYDLTGVGDGYPDVISLDDGVSISISNDMLKYNQIGGLIGPSNRRNLEISLDLNRADALVSGSLRIEQDFWGFRIEKSGSRANINGVTVLGSQSGLVIGPDTVVPAAIRDKQFASIGQDVSRLLEKLPQESAKVSKKIIADVICFPSDCFNGASNSSPDCNPEFCECFGVCWNRP